MISSGLRDSSPPKPLTRSERMLLVGVLRFLVGVRDPAIAPKAAHQGYDDEEHSYGWSQYVVAAGQTVPFSMHLSFADAAALLAGADVRAKLKELDTFENTWFERPRGAIRRFVPQERREAVEAAFYKDLTQQPEGPNVVGSVALFLKRVDELGRSREPGAAKAHALLVKKGLTPAVVERLRATLEEVKNGPKGISPISREKQDAATRAERDAFENVMLWYRDWASTLRTSLDYRSLVRLGLRQQAGGRKTADTSSDATVDETAEDSVDEGAKETAAGCDVA